MRSIFSKIAVVLGLTAAVLGSTTAQAQEWHRGGYWHEGYRGDRGATAAVVAGIVGLAVGAAIADSRPNYPPPPYGYYGGQPAYGYPPPPPPSYTYYDQFGHPIVCRWVYNPVWGRGQQECTVYRY